MGAAVVVIDPVAGYIDPIGEVSEGIIAELGDARSVGAGLVELASVGFIGIIYPIALLCYMPAVCKVAGGISHSVSL